MQQTVLIFSMILCGMILGCKSTQNITPDAFQGTQIRFGSGGGFTGAVTQWALLDNGRMWGVSGVPTAALQDVGKVPKKMYKSIFGAIDSLSAMGDMDAPGNMYRFLEIHTPEKVTRITWDPQNKEVPSQLNAFFDRLKPIMKSVGPAPNALPVSEDSSSDE